MRAARCPEVLDARPAHLGELKPAVPAGAFDERTDRAAGRTRSCVGIRGSGRGDSGMAVVDRSLTQGERAPPFVEQARDPWHVLAARQELDLRPTAATAFAAARGAIEQHRDLRLQAGGAQLLAIAKRGLQAGHELGVG